VVIDGKIEVMEVEVVSCGRVKGNGGVGLGCSCGTGGVSDVSLMRTCDIGLGEEVVSASREKEVTTGIVNKVGERR
jgi:hypothetical protein